MVAKMASVVKPKLSEFASGKIRQSGQNGQAMTRLADLLNQLNVSPAALAKALDIDQSTVTKWTRYGRVPRTQRAAAIASFLKVPVHALFEPVGTPAHPAGLAEPPAAYAAPPPTTHDADAVLAAIQEEVAAQLAAHSLPRNQSDILAVSRAVEREITRLGELPRFPATLELRVSKRISQLQAKWQHAKASL